MYTTALLFLLYTLLLCWPSIYRITLPGQTGTYVYYGIAYCVPILAGTILLFRGRNSNRQLIYSLIILILLSFSLAFAQGGRTDSLSLLYALKFYIAPLMLLSLGFYFGSRVSKSTVIRLIAGIALGHLIFSLLFYWEYLSNPVYYGGLEYSENWTTTVGILRAFIGLTLSKFDLAYQLGFIVVGLLLFRQLFSHNRVAYWVALLASLTAIAFTYNKTVYLVIVVAMMICISRSLSVRARVIGIVASTVVFGGMAYFVILFLSGDLPLSDVIVFLSPQTFWSRVAIWESSASFGFENILLGLGAGYFTRMDRTLDNQYLLTYLELGLVGAIAYFALLASWVRQLSINQKNAIVFLCLLALTSVIGDMLNAVVVMYIVGLFIGIGDYQPAHSGLLITNSFSNSGRAALPGSNAYRS